VKVLQLINRRQFRGAEVFAANLSESLIKSGHEVLFVGIYPPAEEAVEVKGATNIDLNGRKSILISFRLIKNLRRVINEWRPDIVQANGSDTLKYALLTRYLCYYYPILYRNISIISAWMNERPFRKLFYSWAFKKIDYVSCVGHESRNDLLRLFPFVEVKSNVIRRGVHFREVDKKVSRLSIRDEFGISLSQKLVVHVGHFSREKNHAFLIEAFQQVAKADSNIKLILVGGGKLFPSIRDKIIEMGLSNTIILAGIRTDPQPFLSGADLVVLCSFVEGIPGVILEAAAHKVPAIAVSVGGIKEIIKDGETGLSVSHHEVSTFSRRILDILRDERFRQQLGENAFRFVRSEFDVETNAHSFEKLYRQLIRRGE
jgi:L-malate glycosyltransferase